MLRTGLAVLVLTLSAAEARAAAPQGAASVIAAAEKAMGADHLNAIRMYGSGANFTLGQSNHPGGPWPRVNLNDYVRTIDFTQPATRASAVTWAAPPQGTPAVRGAFNQGSTGADAPWAQQLEIWTTPWGFLKGAEKNHATLSTRAVNGRTYRVLTWSTPQKSPGGSPYKVVGYIGPANLVERVETWVENPLLGDLDVQREYRDWRDANGVMYPSTIVERRFGQPTFEAQILGVQADPPDLQRLLAPPAGPPPGGPPPYNGPTSEKLADGVWRINGAYNSLAIEFRDHVLVFEPGPQTPARAEAVIAETRRLIPGKPIRYGVISHHHNDHTGGLAAVAAEGITIVTTDTTKPYIVRALSAPRTLAPDALAKSGKTPVVEGFAGDRRVFTDGARTFELHRIKGLPHADGLVVGWLPKEKILVFADMFNLPPASEPVPNPPIVGTQVFLANLERLKIEPERILSIHSQNPDRLVTMADIRNSLGVKR